MNFNIADGTSRSHVPQKFPLRIFDYAYAYALQFLHATDTAPQVTVPDSRYNVAADNDFVLLSQDRYLAVNEAQLVNFDFSRVNTLTAGYVAVYDFFRFVSELVHDGHKALVLLAPNESQVDPQLRARLAARDHVKLDLYDWTLSSRIIQAIGARVNPAIAVIDLTGYFQCRQEVGEKLYLPGNTHWNLEGNALAGQVIASYLLQHWFDVPATLPQDLQHCAFRKEQATATTSPAAIDAFITETLLSTIRARAEEETTSR